MLPPNPPPPKSLPPSPRQLHGRGIVHQQFGHRWESASCRPGPWARAQFNRTNPSTEVKGVSVPMMSRAPAPGPWTRGPGRGAPGPGLGPRARPPAPRSPARGVFWQFRSISLQAIRSSLKGPARLPTFSNSSCTNRRSGTCWKMGIQEWPTYL